MTASAPATRYADLLAAHGAEPSRWPPDVRAIAVALRAATPDADALERDAAALDAWLDAAPVPPPPAMALRASILAVAAGTPQLLASPVATVSRPSPWRTLVALWHDLGGTRLAAPALAMALACGVGLGWLLQPQSALAATQDGDDLLVLAQFDDHYTELSP